MTPTRFLAPLASLTKPRPIAATLGAHLAAAARRVALNFALFAGLVLLAFAIPGNDFGVGTMDYVAPEHGAAAAAEHDAADERAERILAAHDCWTGEAPEGVEIPGGVVMSLDGGRVRHYGDDEHVAQALDHLFASADAHVDVVIGFCR